MARVVMVQAGGAAQFRAEGNGIDQRQILQFMLVLQADFAGQGQ